MQVFQVQCERVQRVERELSLSRGLGWRLRKRQEGDTTESAEKPRSEEDEADFIEFKSV